MNPTLFKSLLASAPVALLIAVTIAVFRRRKSPGSLLQLLGAVCLAIVVLTHVAEALGLFPQMHWGDRQSVGHYVDLVSALLGLTLVPVGYLFDRYGR